jgi:hypothetical protein
MTTLQNYHGLEIPSSTPGTGGAAISDNFQSLIDWHPLSTWMQAGNPTASDDNTQNYYPGSLWLNISTNQLFLCMSSATGAAVWVQVMLASQANQADGYLGLNAEGVAEGILVGRTGTEAQLDAIVLNQGEWAYATDTKQPKVGDGATSGGLAMVRINSNGSITVPDASAGTAGNVRGYNAVDLQALRNTATQVASGDESFIGNGYDNTASGGESFIGSGEGNTAGGYRSFVGSGSGNASNGYNSFIGCGDSNIASGMFSFIGNGQSHDGANTASGAYSFIGNGSDNHSVSGSYYTFIGNGGYNTALGNFSLIGNGRFHSAGETCSTIVNGIGNRADGTYSSVTNGVNNSADGSYAAVVSGGHGTALGLCSTVLNGKNCVASGSYSTVINGAQDQAGGAVAAKSFQMVLGCSTQSPDKIWQSWYSLSAQTSSTTAIELTLDGNAPNGGTTESTSNRFLLVQVRAYFGTLKIVGKQSGSSNIAAFDIQIAVSSGSSGSAVLTTISTSTTNPNSWPVPTVQIGSGPAGFAGVLQVLCASPNTSTTIQWMCLFNCSEITI